MSTHIAPAQYSDFVRKLYNRSGDPSKDFTHAILGVVTETYEYRMAYDSTNALEELGDLEFYVEALAQVIDDKLDMRPSPCDDTTVERIGALLAKVENDGYQAAVNEACNNLLDEAKRWVGYGKEPKNLLSTWHEVAALTYVVNIRGGFPNEDRQAIRSSNMRKLLKRYPGGEFSQFHALVRDTEAEREAIQRAAD